ncbi:RepB family protein [Aeromonas diversa]|nr:RepB family protein [Aeromonas diversa]
MIIDGIECENEPRREALDSATRQRLHVRRKQETHARLQCWISRRHANRLAVLVERLEDSQASLIEQAIDLLYEQELSDQQEG